MTGGFGVFRARTRHLIATGLALAVYSACGAQAQQPLPVLAKIKKDGVLKVCYGQLSPESYKDPKTGEWVGVQVDLVQMLADW